MSVILCTARTSNSFTIRMDELENVANQYDQFKIEYKKKTASTFTTITWTDTSAVNHYSQKVITGLLPATEYEIWIYAMYQGIWYVAGTYYSSIFTYAPTITNVQLWEAYHNLILAWESLSGATYEVKLEDLTLGTTYYFQVNSYSSEYGYYEFEPVKGHVYSIYVAAIINGQYSQYYWGYSNHSTKKTLTKPSLNVNNNIVTKTSSYDVVLEYEQVDQNSSYPFDRVSRDIFYIAAAHYGEDSLLDKSHHLKRFIKSQVVYKTFFNASAQGEFVNIANGWVDDVISRLNQIINPTEFSRTTGSTYDVSITFGTRVELFSSDSELYNGLWSHNEIGGVISSGTIKIAIDPINETVEHAIYEEMVQVLGLGNDHYLVPDSLFYQIAYPNPTQIVDVDEASVRLLYNYNLPIGGTDEELAKIVNSVCFTKQTSATKTLNFLNIGKQYKIRAYAVSGSNYSDKTDWIYFTPTAVRPNNWFWSLNTSGQDFNMDYIQWNNFCSSINEFRRYKGLIDYVFTTVQSNWDFSHTYINQAIKAINDMNPPAGVAAELLDSVGNGKIASGNTVYRWYFDNLSGALNSIT